MVEKRTRDPLLYNMDKWVESLGKKVTKLPVYVRVSRFKDRDEVARLVKYPNEYEVVFNRLFVEQYRDNPLEIKKVIAHEIAHIKYPGDHTKQFQTEAQRLGAGDRCVGRGTVGKSSIKKPSAK